TRRIVDAVNATRPDLIAVVGDLVEGSVDDLGSDAEPIAAPVCFTGLGFRCFLKVYVVESCVLPIVAALPPVL
ncbi:hypothetical protein PUR49_05255, partial [Streptomyces sp. BE147]|uniref:hypothetical protein n=1 Tax=Streptomyces sp. BE147 TaxID=3002524 RepID=UPI002E7A51C2